MNRYLLIDGHNFLFKSFAVPFSFASKNGTPLQVVTTFLSLIRKAAETMGDPDNIIVVFDTEGGNSNHSLSEEYKSNRPASYEHLEDSPFKHLPFIKTVLDFINIPWIEKPGDEADDVIATLAEKALETVEAEVLIASSDSDFFQLLDSERVNILNPSKQIGYDKKWFVNEFGFTPDRYVEYKAYVGDKTDNISGIVGIGPIRAKQIILGEKQFHLSDQERERLILNKKLITLNRNVAVKMPIETYNRKLLFMPNKEIFDSCNF